MEGTSHRENKGAAWSGPFVAGVVSLLFYGALFLVPLIGGFVALLSPLPLVRELALGRPAFTAWGWVLVVLVGGAFLAPSSWLTLAVTGYLLVAVWPTVSVEVWQRRPWSTGRWLAILTLGAWAVASSVAAAFLGPERVAEELPQLTVRWMLGHQQTAKLWGLGESELLQAVAGMLGYLTPFLVAIYVMGVGLLLWSKLPLLGFAQGRESFLAYVSEEWLPLGFVVGGLGWVFAPGAWGWLAANLLACVLALYFVHGTAIILAYLGPRWGSSRWVRMAVVVLGIQVPIAFIYAGLGLLDSFVRLRPSSDNEGSSS
ncbi:MAG: hypothetical protein ACOY7U_07615 [Acidobacteriota bacterium]